VLVVEGAEFFLHLATDVLGRRYEALGVRTVAEARHVLATRQIDVVLTDLHLADGDARDVLRSLPRPLPVVVLSGRDETHLFGDAWDELKRLGARDVVQKGLNMEDALAQKVDRVVAALAR
jgi:CheY-like chemotaxis protein